MPAGGMLFVAIYILMIFYAILEGIGSRPHSMDGLALMILTAPWSFLLAIALDTLGIEPQENDPYLFLYVVFGGLINSAIVYLLGLLSARLFRYLSSLKPNP